MAEVRVLSPRWSRLKPLTAKQETGVIMCGNREHIKYYYTSAITES